MINSLRPLRALSCILLLIAAALILLSSATAQSLFDVNYGGARSHPFDVLHIALDLRIDDAKGEVSGSVAHRVRSLDPKLASVRLDAAENMEFSRITVDGTQARYEHSKDILTVMLPAARAYNDTLTIAIDYRVKPTKGMYFRRPDSLTPERRNQVWTQGEAEDNRYWIPLYDYPNDQATSELTATVRGDWKVLSNGLLQSKMPKGDGTTTWHYVMDKPHSSYLIMMAAGDYLVTPDTVGTIPLEYWSYPDMPERVEPTFGRTPDIIRYVERMIGIPYPWSKYAQITIAEFMFGGMENTTATTLNDYMLIDARGRLDYNPDNTIAHEIAHQWFGDMVTNRSWRDLWLHESYATYLAARYIGYRYGDDTFQELMYDAGIDGLEADQTIGRDPMVGGKGHIVNLYKRGARVLHMLNQLVGDDQFWRANRLFLQRHAYGLAETNDLKIAFEDVTGLNLDWFFDEWIYKAGAPDFKVDYTYAGDSLRLRVRQQQVVDSLTGLFRMPVPVEVYLMNGVIRDTIWVSKADEIFTIAVPRNRRFVIFDAGDAMLKNLDFIRPEKDLIAQLDAPRTIDRLLAVKALAASFDKSSKSRPAALRDAFLRESSPFVREAIVKAMGMFDSPLSGEVIARALIDTSVKVRRNAVEMSFLVADKKRRAELLRPLLADSSNNVVMATLGMMALTQPEGLEPVLHDLAGIKGRRDRLASAWLSAVSAGKYNSLVDDIILYTRPGYSRHLRAQAYSTLGELDTTTDAMRLAIERGLREDAEIINTAAASAARRHLNAPMRQMLARLRGDLSEKKRETIDKILSAQKDLN